MCETPAPSGKDQLVVQGRITCRPSDLNSVMHVCRWPRDLSVKSPESRRRGRGLGRGRRRAAFPVLLIRRLEHVLALQLGVEPGADEEGAAHLAVQRVRLLGRRREPLLEHHRDEVVDPLGGGLGAEVEQLCGGEGLAEDHHRVHVSVYHRLGGKDTDLMSNFEQMSHFCELFLTSETVRSKLPYYIFLYNKVSYIYLGLIPS